jgi:hypothetical protein
MLSSSVVAGSTAACFPLTFRRRVLEIVVRGQLGRPSFVQRLLRCEHFWRVDHERSDCETELGECGA